MPVCARTPNFLSLQVQVHSNEMQKTLTVFYVEFDVSSNISFPFLVHNLSTWWLSEWVQYRI